MIALAGPLAEQRFNPTTPEQRRVLWAEYWKIDLDHARHHIQACGADGQWVGHQVRGLLDKHWPAIKARCRGAPPARRAHQHRAQGDHGQG
jgi:hypothetical protein